MFRKLALGGAVVLAAGLTLIGVQLAQAHSRPIRFDPAPGAVLTSAPAQISGWFTAELRRDPSWNFIRVTDAQGNRVDTGDPVLSTDRRQMTVSLRSGLGPGTYTVSWRSWDDNDGVIFGDCHTFFVGQAAADAAVAAKTRMDGGGSCQRLEIDAKDATPTAGQVATATAPEAESEESSEHSEADGDSEGVPVWGLALGIVAGVIAGGVGGRFVGSRPKA